MLNKPKVHHERMILKNSLLKKVRQRKEQMTMNTIRSEVVQPTHLNQRDHHKRTDISIHKRKLCESLKKEFLYHCVNMTLY